MKYTSAFSLTLAFSLGVVLAPARATEPPSPMVLGTFSYGAVVTLPAATFRGRIVKPKVNEYAGGVAILSFRAADITPDSPDTRIDVLVQEVSGVKDLDDAKAHFRLTRGIDVDRGEHRFGNPIEMRETEFGKVTTIDVAMVGWVPGNTWSYVFVSAQAGGGRARTYFVGPLWRIDLGLARLKIARGRF